MSVAVMSTQTEHGARLTISGPESGLDSRTLSDEDGEVWVGLLQSHIVLFHKVSVNTQTLGVIIVRTEQEI